MDRYVRFLKLGLVAPTIFLVACSGVDFQVQKGSQLETASICGTDGSENSPGPKITSPPIDQFVQAQITVEGTCDSTGGAVTLSGTGLTAPVTTTCTGDHFSQAVTLKSGDGMKDLDVQQAGVTGDGKRCIYLDTTPPHVTITPPRLPYSNSATLPVEGDCENGLDVQLSQDGTGTTATATCTNGHYSTDFPSTNGDGVKTIVAAQVDHAGNRGSDQANYTVDTNPPIVHIVTPVADAPVKTSVGVTGTCESGLPVLITGSAVSTPVTLSCDNSSFSTTLTLANQDGTLTIIAQQTDLAGNQGRDQRNVLRDTTPPAVKITAPAAGTIAPVGVTLMGTCTDGFAVNISGAGVSSPTNVNCNTGTFSTAITFSSGDGAKHVIASQTDAAGNVGSDARDFVRDSSAPAVKITSPAALTQTRAAIALQGTCETGLSVALSGDIAAMNVVCTSGQFSANVTLNAPDGTKTVKATQTDGAGNVGTDSRNFVLDTSVPGIHITGPAAGTAAQTGVTLVGTCSDGLPIQVSGSGVNQNSTANCSSGQFSIPITFSAGDGTKSVTVSQTDSAGNQGSDSRSFVRDTTAPSITITAPPAGTAGRDGLTLLGNCTDGLPIQIAGSGVNAASTATCTGGQFSAPIIFSNGDGTKHVTVSQTDAAGNVGSDARDFVRSTVGPAIAITSPAAGFATQGPLTLGGTCTNGYDVVIGGDVSAGMTTACNAGVFSVTLTLSAPDGTKTLTASQTDSLGNSSTASRSFVLDTTPPAVKITSPAAGSYVGATMTLAGTCTSGLIVNISGSVNAPSTTACTSGQFSASVTLSTGDGTKTLNVSQTDAAGNQGSDSRAFVLDASAPIVKITSPAVGTVAQTGLTVSGSCETGLNVMLSGAGVSAATSTACTSGAFSAPVTFSAGDGSKVVVASQTDAAGNKGTDTRSFVKDSTPPAVTIASPAAGTVTKGDLTITGNCETGLPVNVSGNILAPSMAVCVAGTYSAAVTLASPDGSKTVTVSQTDAIGNSGTASRAFTLDATGPAVKITSPAAGSLTGSSLTLSGTCETGLAVVVSGDVSGNRQTSCTSGAFSVALTLSSGDGTKTLTASQTDTAGNTGSDTRNFVLDSTAPLVKFTSPAAGTVAQNGLTVSGTCETGLNVQLSGPGLGTPGPVSCTSGQFSAAITFSSGDGSKTIIATQTDSLGNSGSDTRAFVKDSTAPAVKIVSPNAGAVTQSGLTLTGTCETGLTVTLSGDAGSSTTACTSGQFSFSLTLSGADGAKSVQVSQTDAAGNTGSDTRSFVLDTTAPLVTITSPTNGSTITSGFTLQGTCEAGLALVVTGDISSTNTSTCPASGQFSVALNASSGSGTKTVRATQTDLAGNSGFAQSSYTVQGNPTATEVFTADSSEGKVDILFIDDNSASMEFEQNKLGQKFSSFVSELVNLDWQVGITTTDCSTGTWGICGSLLPMTGTATDILTPAIPSYDQVFMNTIYRPETVDCVARGACPSGNEEGLKAMIGAMDKRASDDTGFFRDGAALAIVELTDEDEQSTAPPTATTPQAVIDHFNGIWGASKKLRAYAITILPGDTACLQMQQDQQGGIGAYGTYPIGLATLTGGKSESICEDDYSGILKQIGDDLRTVTSAVTLSRVPLAGTVSVTFSPSQNITWTVSGQTVLFNSPVPAGTQISVTYEY